MRRAFQILGWEGLAVLVVVSFAGCANVAMRGSSSFEVLGAPDAGMPGARAEAAVEDEGVRIDSVPVRAEAPLARPVYPRAALKAGAGEYVVFVTVRIDASGKVTDVGPNWWRITARGPFVDDFFAAVKAAVMSWRLSPARQVYYRKHASGEENYDRTETVAETVEVKFVFDAKGAVR